MVVYTDFESKIPIQLEQLFPILTEEIHNFCSTTNVVDFIIGPGAKQNLQELKMEIESEPIFMQTKPVSSMGADEAAPELQKVSSIKEGTTEEAVGTTEVV